MAAAEAPPTTMLGLPTKEGELALPTDSDWLSQCELGPSKGLWMVCLGVVIMPCMGDEFSWPALANTKLLSACVFALTEEPSRLTELLFDGMPPSREAESCESMPSIGLAAFPGVALPPKPPSWWL